MKGLYRDRTTILKIESPGLLSEDELCSLLRPRSDEHVLISTMTLGWLAFRGDSHRHRLRPPKSVIGGPRTRNNTSLSFRRVSLRVPYAFARCLVGIVVWLEHWRRWLVVSNPWPGVRRSSPAARHIDGTKRQIRRLVKVEADCPGTKKVSINQSRISMDCG